MTKHLDIFLSIVVITATLYLAFTLLDRRVRVPLDVTESRNHAELINKILNNLMEGTDADRAYLFQFHDGVTGIAGNHFIKYTNTHEVCALGISSEIMTLQGLPISILAPTWLPKLENNTSFRLQTKDETHNQTRHILEDQGIECMVIARILFLGKIIGFVGVDYVHVHKAVACGHPTDFDPAQLEEAAYMIQSIITEVEQ